MKTPILLALAVALTPTLSFAASTKTYTFNAASADIYDTTGSISFTDSNSTVAWYNANWKYRQKITINKESIGEDLTDFPVVIRLDDVSLTGARDDRHDILFTTSDGVTKLSHELEDNTTAWVKVPKLTPLQDTELYLYYGNPTAEDQQNVSDVWTNGYAGVWHLNNNPEGTIYDSTKNNNDGSQSGGMNKEDSLRDGKISKSLALDGSDDRVVIPSSVISSYPFTLTTWADISEAGTGALIDIGSSNSDTINYGIVLGGSGVAQIHIRNGGSYVTNSSSSLGSGFRQVVGVFRSATDREIYVNGVSESKSSTSITLNTTIDQVFLGDRADRTPNHAYEGLIDEARITSVSRSNAWIRAEYLNQSNTEDFLSINSDVETTPYATTDSSTSTSAITLQPTQALPFTKLLSFTPNTQPTTTFQLSNDAGKTWLFYTKDGWKGANPINSLHRSSINDISSHIKSFPQGAGKLTFTAYLEPGSTLDSLSIGYTPSTNTSTTTTTGIFSSTIISLNSLYRQAYNQDPSFLQWTYWAKRMLVEKKTQQEWLGAMMWAAR